MQQRRMSETSVICRDTTYNVRLELRELSVSWAYVCPALCCAQPLAQPIHTLPRPRTCTHFPWSMKLSP